VTGIILDVVTKTRLPSDGWVRPLTEPFCMTGPNNNNEVAWLFIVFVGGGIRICRRRNCASDSDLRIRCSSTFIADLFLWDRRGTYVSAQQVLDIQLAAPSAFASYVAVQGVGFVCNLTIYTFALLVFHRPTASLLCLALASAVGLFLTTWVPSG